MSDARFKYLSQYYRLPHIEFKILTLLVAFGGKAIFTYQELGVLFDVHYDTIARAVANLIKLNLIKIGKGIGAKRMFELK